MKKIMFLSFFVLFIFSLLSSDIGRRPVPVKVKGELLPNKRYYEVGDIINLKITITPTNIEYRGIDFEDEKYFIKNNFTVGKYSKLYKSGKKPENLAIVISNSINDSIIFLEDYDRNLIIEITAKVVKETNYIEFGFTLFQYIDADYEKSGLLRYNNCTEIKYNNSIIKGAYRQTYGFVNNRFNPDPIIISEVKSCDKVINTHINTAINCTFKEAIKIPKIKKSFSELDENTRKKKFSVPVKNHKVVFQNVKNNLYIFKGSDEKSLQVNKGDAVTWYYNDSYYKEPYFLIEYKDREIPTLFPDLTLKILPKWEKKWIKENNVSQEYFDTHIRVKYIGVRFWDKNDFSEFCTAKITYYFTVGWAKIKLKDNYVIEEHEHSVILNRQTKITKIYPIESVVPIQEIVAKVSSISDSINMNLNHLTLDQRNNNKLTANFHCNRDLKNNLIWKGKVDIETGDISLNKKARIYVEIP